MSLHLFLRLGIFDDELGALGKAFGQDDHGAAGAYGVGETVQRVSFAGQVNQYRHL